MNPNDLPSPEQAEHAIRALPSLHPKRRFKAEVSNPAEKDARSVIVPFYNPAPKPARFTRSGHPFQVWKEPKTHRDDAPPRKPDFRSAVSESLQAYGRSMGFLLSWRLDHSP
jgi:hypothetical protein